MHRFAPLVVGLIVLTLATPTAGQTLSHQTKAEALAQARQILQQVFQMARDVEDERIDRDELLGRIAYWQSEVGDFDGVFQTLKVIERASSKDWVLYTIAMTQAKAGQISSALRTVALIESDLGKAEALAEIAPIQAEAESREAATQMLIRALELAHTGEERYGNDRHFTLRRIIKAWAAVSDVEGAIRAATTLENPETKREALQDIVEAQARRADFAGAFQTLSLLSSSDKRRALRDIAVAQAEAGDVRGAIETAMSIADLGVKGTALTEIGLAQIKSGKRRSAAPILREARQAIVDHEHQYYRNLDLLDIIEAQVQAELYDDGFETIAAMLDPRWQDKGRREIAQAQAKQGDSLGAFRTAAKIEDLHEKLWAYAEIAEALAKAGHKHGVVLASKRTTQIFQSRQVAQDFGALQTLASAQAEIGDIAGALKTASMIEALWRQDSVVVSDIAWAQTKAGNVDAARDLIETIKDELSKAGALEGVAYEQARAGDTGGGLEWAAKERNLIAKMYALLGVAEGILKRLEEEKTQANASWGN